MDTDHIIDGKSPLASSSSVISHSITSDIGKKHLLIVLQIKNGCKKIF
jgi:hypothetical protein